LGRRGVTWRPPGTGKVPLPRVQRNSKEEAGKMSEGLGGSADGELFWKCYNPGCGSPAQPAASPEARRLDRSPRDFRDLAEKFGLETVTRHGKAWLSVPYVERGRVVNHKYRLISEKRHEMDTGGRLTLWNHDCLLEDSKKPVVICEGEWDALVAIGLGYRAVSVPNGASGGEGELSYLWDARDLLNRVESFILATDSDEAGIKLRSNLVAHLGPIAARSSTTGRLQGSERNACSPTVPDALGRCWTMPSRSRSRASTRSTISPSGPSSPLADRHRSAE
jgi:hypothetical protein